jgi:hypothetical protein
VGRRTGSKGDWKELQYDEGVFEEEGKGEVEYNSKGGIIKPAVKPSNERLRSNIPERNVFDEDCGMGRGAEVAVVNGFGELSVEALDNLVPERVEGAAVEEGFVGATSG